MDAKLIDVEYLKAYLKCRTDGALAEVLSTSVDTVRSWKKRGVPAEVKLDIIQNAPPSVGINNTQNEKLHGHMSEKELEIIMAYRKLSEVEQREVYYMIMLKEIQSNKALSCAKDLQTV